MIVLTGGETDPPKHTVLMYYLLQGFEICCNITQTTLSSKISYYCPNRDYFLLCSIKFLFVQYKSF